MRLWTLHPKYLDSKGLVAVWREALLAKAVLEDRTNGYKNHPQLNRFIDTNNPIQAITYYLNTLFKEAESRGYHFDQTKIVSASGTKDFVIYVTEGQVKYEFELLKAKLENRNKEQLKKLSEESKILINEIFILRKGSIEAWEKPKKEILSRLSMYG
jgi:hypothetical protein